MKNRISRWSLVLLLLAGPRAAAAPQETDRPARPALPPLTLVALLGNGSFAIREEAAAQLARLGRAAVPALKDGTKHPDREVRYRCEQLLPLAQRTDLDVQLDAFVLNSPDRSVPPLTGWQRFQDLAGNDLAGRMLFVRLYREDRALLELLEKDPAQLATQVTSRAQRLLQKASLPNPNGKPEAASLEVVGLFLAACAGKPDQQLFDRLQSIFYQPAVRAALQDFPATRRLAARVLTQRTGDLNSISQIIWMAQYLELTELLEDRLKPVVRKQLEDPKLADDLSKLNQAVYLASSLGLNEEIEGRLKPLVRKLAAAPVTDRNMGRFHQVVNMAQVLGMQDLIDLVLKPAACKQMQAAAGQVGDQGLFWQARIAAQVLGLTDVFEAMMKPAAGRLIADAADHPDDASKFYQAIFLAQSLNMQEALEGALRPAARRHILCALEQPGDVNRLQQAVQMARNLDLRDLLNDTVKPVVRKQASALVGQPSDLARLSQLYHLAQNVAAADVIEECIKPALRKYFESVKDKPIDQVNLTQALQLARTLRLKEAVPLALKAALAKQVNGYSRGTAIFFIGELGTREQLAQLEPLLTEATVIGSSGVNWTSITAQVRDVALAVLLQSNGQSLAEYGYPYFQIVQGIRLFQTTPSCVGFADDASRQAAFKQWKEWQAKQKK